MRRTRFFWLLCTAFCALALMVVLACGSLASWHFRRALQARAAADLELEAGQLAALLAGAGRPLAKSPADSLCKAFGRGVPARLTVILADGVVIGDSDQDPRFMENHAHRPEVSAALRGSTGIARRSSPTQSRPLLYVAVPIRPPEAGEAAQAAPLGVVRASLPLAVTDAPVRAFSARVWLLMLLAAIASAAIAAFVARQLVRPLHEIGSAVGRLAAGDLEARVPRVGQAEVAALAGALNEMADGFARRMRDVTRRSNEQEAVLCSMMEGVLAVDNESRIIRLNEAAARLLRVDSQRSQGRPLQEIARHVDLHRFVERVLSAQAPQEGEFVVRDDARDEGERILQAQGTVLRDEKGSGIGGLIVLNDVTRLRRLETMRREFVANVSHELKTPITAIKGFVETLIEGKNREPGETARHLDIVQRQADRLNAIVEDLLTLSRLEQDDRGEQVEFQLQAVHPILAGAVQACEVSAREKGIAVALTCAPELAARLNAQLLEQAVVNLLDNAIKYSEPGRPVEISAARTAAGLVIRVRDRGCGISEENLPRLFERFYRVDRGRSRRQGGTGLGLSIVKHIVRAHGGTVNVESKPGEGSAFTVILP